jgi:hypothetical protein
MAGRLDPTVSLPGNSPESAAAGRLERTPGMPDTPNAASNYDGIPERLEQLGATYYVLESWGNNLELYRFHCKMAVTDSADYTRCFEATDADPHQAMQQVLQQVESWRQRAGSGG